MSARRLVIADDDREMRAWLRDVLRPLKADIREAASGDELLAALSNEGPFDLVITDLRMPAPSGVQVVAMARTAGLATPFLLLTAFADDSVRTFVDEVPSASLVDKPAEATVILALARRLMEPPSA